MHGEAQAVAVLEKLAVNFHRREAKFVAGEEITGEVLIKVPKSLPVTAVSVKLLGAASVCWDECGVIYRDSECYVNVKITYYGDGRGHKSIIDQQSCITPGTHNLPFSFLLPEALPPSFSALYGAVRYSVQAKLKRPLSPVYVAGAPFLLTLLPLAPAAHARILVRGAGLEGEGGGAWLASGSVT
ncbi:arrestin domain-containing protein 17-like [Petromyzon marinus]|uniref:arrestin domain-containing protein 17-like n=1 Tax=Petromyzon marinus TaxID=7757 RepID=UPI003F70F90A